MIRKYWSKRSIAYLAALCAVIGLSIIVIPTVVHCQSSADDVLDITIVGLRLAATNITSGTGKVVVHNVSTSRDEGVVDTETDYDVKVDFANGKFKYVGITTYTRNDSPTAGPFATGSRLTREGLHDGTKAERFDHESRNATIFEKPDGPQQAAYLENFLRPCSLVLDFDVSKVDEMLRDGLRVARREMLDGEECIVLEVSRAHPAAPEQVLLMITHVYWVSPNQGFTIKKSETYFSGGNWGKRTLKSRRCMEVRKLNSELWVPAKYTYVEYGKGASLLQQQVLLSKTITFDLDFQFNVPVRKDQLLINLPSGTHVRDELLNAEYTVP